MTSKGAELEISGHLSENTRIVFGATTLSLEDDKDDPTFLWVPRRTLNLLIDTRLPVETPITVGVSGNWRSKTSAIDSYTTFIVRQDDYVVLNAFGRWDVTERLQARLNLNNLADKKYITSLYSVGYYAAPRNFMASLQYAF